MPSTWSWIAARMKRWGLAGAIVGLVGVGVVGLSTAVGWPLALAGLAVALLAAFAKFNEIAGRVVGAVVVGTLVLVGVNVGACELGAVEVTVDLRELARAARGVVLRHHVDVGVGTELIGDEDRMASVSASRPGITRWGTISPRRATPWSSPTRSPTWRCISRTLWRATSG